jgi:hypothetical protein
MPYLWNSGKSDNCLQFLLLIISQKPSYHKNDSSFIIYAADTSTITWKIYQTFLKDMILLTETWLLRPENLLIFTKQNWIHILHDSSLKGSSTIPKFGWTEERHKQILGRTVCVLAKIQSENLSQWKQILFDRPLLVTD